MPAPGLPLQEPGQAQGHPQQALREGAVHVGLVAAQGVHQDEGWSFRGPWRPLGPHSEQEGRDLVTPGHNGPGEDMKQEVCGLRTSRGGPMFDLGAPPPPNEGRGFTQNSAGWTVD